MPTISITDVATATMRNHPARAMYDQLEGTLMSITMQLRSAIQADAAWTRQVTAELASVLLDTLGLVATIEWHLHQFQKCTGIVYELTVKDAAGFEVPEQHAAAMFEIYHDALSNVMRHAGASRVAVSLTITPHELTLVVQGDGAREGGAALTASLPHARAA